ncbi:hypothetical protein [Pedobacter aquatilis]|uniref:hypothetical protein n=1 Tax=Pedobacter aquatilis TaxID=351343 RepID=UPI00292E3171|nr:hypothetical protein [Pedobacter aquatilis]
MPEACDFAIHDNFFAVVNFLKTFGNMTPLTMKYLCFAFLLFFYFATANAQEMQPINFSFNSQRISLKEVLLTITAEIKPGWKLFAMDNYGPERLNFSFPYSGSASPLGGISAATPIFSNSEQAIIGKSYYEHSAIFTQRIRTKLPSTFFKGQITFTASKGEDVLGPVIFPFSTMLR